MAFHFVITPASTRYVKAATEVMFNSVITRPASTIPAAKSKKTKQHLCLDKAYTSRMVKQETNKHGYVPHMPYNRKRVEVIKEPKKPHKKEILREDGCGENKLMAQQIQETVRKV